MIKNDKQCFFEYTLIWEKNNNEQQLPKYETLHVLFFKLWILYIVEMLPDKILKKRITVPCLNRPTYFSPSLCWYSPWPCGTPRFQSPTNVSPFDHLKSSREYQNWYLALKIFLSMTKEQNSEKTNWIVARLVKLFRRHSITTLTRWGRVYAIWSKKCLRWGGSMVKTDKKRPRSC